MFELLVAGAIAVAGVAVLGLLWAVVALAALVWWLATRNRGPRTA